MTLKKFWETDAIGIHELLEENDNKPFMTDVKLDGMGHAVGIPWTENRPKSHYELCFQRLKVLQRKLKDDPRLFTEYDNIIKEQLDNEIREMMDVQLWFSRKRMFTTWHITGLYGGQEILS